MSHHQLLFAHGRMSEQEAGNHSKRMMVLPDSMRGSRRRRESFMDSRLLECAGLHHVHDALSEEMPFADIAQN
jgi:hypothetical protein